MVSRTATIKNESGVHARPAAVFVKMANRYPCEIYVEKDNQRINGKSIMGLMMLALTRDTRIMVTLLSALRDRGLKRGVASLCIGGGEATAVAVELV